MKNPIRSQKAQLAKKTKKIKQNKRPLSSGIIKPSIKIADTENPTQIRSEFKAKAHSLKPIVLLGNKGLTDSVILEINQALSIHELIKIKISGQDKNTQALTTQAVLEKTGSELIQSMGHTVTLYRSKPE